MILVFLQLKKNLTELKETNKKKEMLLTSELDSYKMKSEELEKMLKTNTAVNRIEKEKINEMHLQTVKVSGNGGFEDSEILSTLLYFCMVRHF